MLRPYVDNPSLTRRSARDRVPYVAPAKRGSGLDIPAIAVCKIDSYDGKVIVLAQPDEDSMGCSRLAVMPQHPLDTDDQVRVAHIPITPVPVYYDPDAVNGPPVVGSILGTVEASWKLSTDRQGWRAMWVEEDNERVWVLPDHNWGTWDEPFNGADVDEWFRPDHMDFKYEGVEFEALIRPVGGSGAGVWVPFVYDTHGHLVMINRGAGTPTPSGGTTAPATTSPGGGTTAPYTTPEFTTAPGIECTHCSFDAVAVTVADSPAPYAWANGTFLCNYSGYDYPRCRYAWVGDDFIGNDGETYVQVVMLNLESGGVQGVFVGYYLKTGLPVEDSQNFSSGWSGVDYNQIVQCGESGVVFAGTGHECREFGDGYLYQIRPGAAEDTPPDSPSPCPTINVVGWFR